MIIEVIPFFHIMAANIVGMLGEENSHQIIATVMVAFALSSILTGEFCRGFFLHRSLEESNIPCPAGRSPFSVYRNRVHRVWCP